MQYLFIGFLLSGILLALVRALMGEPDALSDTLQALFGAAELAVRISLGLVGVLALWSGLFRLAEAGRLTDWLSRKVAPLLGHLMPSERHGGALGPVTMNLSANLLGLDNAATPLGLKAMEALQRNNPQPHTATDAMILFLVLNTSSVTLIPVTVFLYRAQQGAPDPAEIYLPLLLATTVSTFFGVWLVARIQKIRLWHPLILGTAGIWLLLLAGLLALTWWLPEGQATTLSSALGNGLLLTVIGVFLLAARRAGADVYDTFVQGAKEGFEVAVRLIPFLVAMLAAIAMLRASGLLDLALDGVRWLVTLAGLDSRFVDALPVAFLKPLSGSGARAMMLEVMATHGVDSFAGRLAAVMQGSTETTFYVLAVYFGSVGVVRMRYALWCGLASDAAGMLTAILATYLFFG